MRQARASKGIKLLFASVFLFSLGVYQTFDVKYFLGQEQNSGIKLPSPLSNGRLLQEECEQFALCADGNCSFQADQQICCVGDVDFENNEPDDFDQCFDTNGKQCVFEDLCVANIIPGQGGVARCLAGFEQERALGIFVYISIILYIFVALAIICDDYFVPCLEKISDALSLTDDVAGATFMAAGSSAPELFVSIADNILANPPQNLGTGAVVGGGVFNVLVIIGLSAVFAGQELDLNWRPFARDYVFYIISVLLLVVFALDEVIEIYEGVILFVFYLCYVVFMVFNARIFIWVDKKLGLLEVVEDHEGGYEKDEEKPAAELKDDEEDMKDDEKEGEEEPKKRRMSKSEALKQYSSMRSFRRDQEEEKGSYWEVFFWPDNLKSQLWYILTTPINVMFRLTVPDCNFDVFCEDKEGKEENRRLGYSLGFIGCIVWIALLSHILVFCTTVFGCLVGIDPSIMGLTLLAVGTNIPDALSSIIVAKAGKGDMAVANSIGSNVFDILVGLGLPWILAGIIFGEGVPITVDDIISAVIFLALSMIFLLAMLLCRSWKLNKYGGIALLLFYVVYVIVELVREFAFKDK